MPSSRQRGAHGSRICVGSKHSRVGRAGKGAAWNATLQCAAVILDAAFGLMAESVLERIQVAPGNAEALHQVVKRGPVQGDGHVAILINNRLFALPGATTAP